MNIDDRNAMYTGLAYLAAGAFLVLTGWGAYELAKYTFRLTQGG